MYLCPVNVPKQPVAPRVLRAAARFGRRLGSHSSHQETSLASRGVHRYSPFREQECGLSPAERKAKTASSEVATGWLCENLNDWLVPVAAQMCRAATARERCAMQYLVDCDCGEYVSVEETAAGTTEVCSCGRAVVIPSLRELRRSAGQGQQ